MDVLHFAAIIRKLLYLIYNTRGLYISLATHILAMCKLKIREINNVWRQNNQKEMIDYFYLK
jgi:hypothetical protein